MGVVSTEEMDNWPPLFQHIGSFSNETVEIGAARAYPVISVDANDIVRPFFAALAMGSSQFNRQRPFVISFRIFRNSLDDC